MALQKPFFATQRAMGAGYRKHSDEKIERARSMRSEGLTIAEIASMLGMGKTTVGEILRGIRHAK